MLDLTEHIYNYWTVLFKTSDKKWRCKCICSKEEALSTKQLRHNVKLSCGCHKLSIKPGDSKNRLTIIKYLGKSQWQALCSCGELTKVSTDHFTSGNTKSCGCLKIEQLAINRLKKKK